MIEKGERNIRLDIQYDGTNYAGWQWQDNAPSIQRTLTKALERITAEKITLHGSGRTDAGVHARGQVANFRTGSSVPTDRFHLAVNGELPADISVHGAREVPSGWDARREAIARHYRYSLDLGETPDVFLGPFALHVPYRLDLDTMRRAAKLFIGRYDFSAFRSHQCGAEHAVRTVLYAGLWTQGKLAHFDIRGHAFLRNMVRIIVGTLLYVGRGKLSVGDVERLLDGGERKRAGPTAAAKGLCLMRVYYPGEE